MKTADLERLERAALAAQRNAYCPYSKFPVGAAVLTASGDIFAGCNVENASYGLSICAERSALSAAVTAGHQVLRAVCIVASSCRPCGACRQVLLEFSTKATELHLLSQKPRVSRRKTTVFALLPEAFDPREAGLLPALAEPL